MYEFTPRENGNPINTDGIYVADTETLTETDYRIHNEVKVYVWSLRPLSSDDEYFGCDVGEFLELCKILKVKKVWFHNLKYDMSYILNWLLKQGYTEGINHPREKKVSRYGNTYYDAPPKNGYKTLITGLGQWMKVDIRYKGHKIQFRDSAKKFPGLGVAQIAETYNIKPKTELNVTMYRGLEWTPNKHYEERILDGEEPDKVYHELKMKESDEFIRVSNDTRIMKVAMKDLYNQGFGRNTMAGDAKQWFLNDLYYRRLGKNWKNPTEYNNWLDKNFPKLNKEIAEIVDGTYRGGYVMLNKRYAGKDLENTSDVDVNSMFPHWMRNGILPCGAPMKVPKRLTREQGFVCMVRFKAIFTVRDGCLPMIQRKNSVKSNHPEYITQDCGGYEEICLTDVDYDLFNDMYVCECIDEEWFAFKILPNWVFEGYVDYWSEQKKDASKMMKEIEKQLREEKDIAERGRLFAEYGLNQVRKATAKRFLNSLYGKFGEKTEREQKKVGLTDGILTFTEENTEGDGWYAPVSSFITAYARDEIVRNAVKLGDRFVYCDTDSIHYLDCDVKDLGLPIDDKELGYFKVESHEHNGKKYTVIPHARYVRPKTYLHCDENYEVMKVYNDFTEEYDYEGVKCCGLSDSARHEVTWDNFRVGAVYHDKMTNRQVNGGSCLITGTMEIRIRK